MGHCGRGDRLFADLVDADWGLWLVVVLGAVVGPYICGKTANDLNCGDHGSIVWDEWAGVWIALAMAPTSASGWLCAFVLFRLFDILKPWPVHRLEKAKPVGWGIMADDLAAGLMAGLCTMGLAYLF